MVANNQILKLIETCLLSICLLKMLELSLSVFYGSKLGSRTWRDKTWKGMDWFLVFITSNAQVTRVSLGLYRTDTSQVGSLLGTWPISDTAGQLWRNIYLYPCWWPTIFSITSQCLLGLRLHYPAAPIASTPYDMGGRCSHRMVVARASISLVQKIEDSRIYWPCIWESCTNREKSPSSLLNPSMQIWSKKSKLWTSKIYNVTVTDTNISWMAWVGTMKLQTHSPLLFNCTKNLCYSTQSQDCWVTLQENPPSWCNP